MIGHCKALAESSHTSFCYKRVHCGHEPTLGSNGTATVCVGFHVAPRIPQACKIDIGQCQHGTWVLATEREPPHTGSFATCGLMTATRNSSCSRERPMDVNLPISVSKSKNASTMELDQTMASVSATMSVLWIGGWTTVLKIMNHCALQSFCWGRQFKERTVSNCSRIWLRTTSSL